MRTDMQPFSLVVPCDEDRLSLFAKTLRRYRELGLDKYDCELVIPTRSLVPSHVLDATPIRHRLVPYSYQGEYFNPAMALNLGVRNASCETILVQSPEVMPEGASPECDEAPDAPAYVVDRRAPGSPLDVRKLPVGVLERWPDGGVITTDVEGLRRHLEQALDAGEWALNMSR
jgi:hypothetical protein